MIPSEIAALRDILLKELMVTNSEQQALNWAHRIQASLEKKGYEIASAGECPRSDQE